MFCVSALVKLYPEQMSDEVYSRCTLAQKKKIHINWYFIATKCVSNNALVEYISMYIYRQLTRPYS